MANPVIHVGKCRLFTFTVLNAAGQIDTTTAATVPADAFLRAVLNPSNPREVAVICLSVRSSNPIVTTSITCLGHSASIGVTTLAAVDQGTVTIDAVDGGPEIDPPAWAV